MMSCAILYGIRFDATSKALVVTAGGVTETLTFGGSLSTSADYFMAPDSLLDLLATCLNTHSEISGASVTLGSDLRIDVSPDCTLQWDNASTTLDKAVFGYTGPARNGQVQPSGIWTPDRPISEDSRNRHTLVGGVATTVSGLVRHSQFAQPRKTRELTIRHILQAKALQEYSPSTAPFNNLEFAWAASMGKGRTFRLFEDVADIGTSDFTLLQLVDKRDPLERDDNFRVYWQATLRARVVTEPAEISA